MNVDLPVIAIVGPNEAGKSSLLRALERLSDGEPFAARGEHGELTRGADVPADQRVVTAEFLLDEPDLAAIRPVREAGNARWLRVWKSADGSIGSEVVPEPRRDRGPRRGAAATLRQASASSHLDGATYEVEDDEEPRALLDDVDQLLLVLDIDQATLNETDVDEIARFATRARTWVQPRHPKYIRDLPDQLTRLVDHERQEHPHRVARNTLLPRRPEFLLFDEEDRTLNSTYELGDVADDPPSALANLASVAQLDLVALRDIARAGDLGVVEAMERAANETLERLFHESWRQASITLRLRVDTSGDSVVLRLLVETIPGSYDSIADRSDGLRWFIALLAYTETHGGEVPPVLLIDEAETHLHYDAQADLVRVFSRQRAAATIIYTTHSAGCLPEDLGAAIRVVSPVPESDRSEVRNWFWEDAPGFSPLFMGMGASALAFTSVRRAVVAEGAADLILLPSVLREATNRSELGFQVAPGLAEVSPAAISELGLVAARVAYVVDGDAGGRAIRKKLMREGVADQLILQIQDGSVGLSLEDLIHPATYLTAVNEELRRSHGDAYQLVLTSLPRAGRPSAVDRLCRARGIDPPSRRAVANRVLERETTAPLIDPKRGAAIRGLHKKIESLLGKPWDSIPRGRDAPGKTS
jgi:hypothetical protein